MEPALQTRAKTFSLSTQKVAGPIANFPESFLWRLILFELDVPVSAQFRG